MADELSSRSLFLAALESGSMIALNILSLVGNILVCISVYRNKRLRTTTNLYIIALAVSDLLSATLVMPLTGGVLITGRWPFGETLCQMNAFLGVFVVYISPVTMGLTALNRFVRICKSDRLYRRIFSRRKSRLLLGAAWTFVALYLVVSRLIGLQESRFDPGYAVCFNVKVSKMGRVIRFVIIVGLFFILPLAVTIFSYRNVIKTIREHNMRAVQGLQSQAGVSGIGSNEIRISRSLFVVVFAFILCWLPLWIISILSRLHIVPNMPRNAELLCTFCLSLSNTINPLIYAGMNRLFRREFRKILCCESGSLVQDFPRPLFERPTGSALQKIQELTTNNDNQRSIPQKRSAHVRGRDDNIQFGEAIELDTLK